MQRSQGFPVRAMFGADDDSELGENATLREADLLKQHSAVRVHDVHAAHTHKCS